MAELTAFLPLAWETQLEFLVAGFGSPPIPADSNLASPSVPLLLDGLAVVFREEMKLRCNKQIISECLCHPHLPSHGHGAGCGVPFSEHRGFILSQVHQAALGLSV